MVPILSPVINEVGTFSPAGNVKFMIRSGAFLVRICEHSSANALAPYPRRVKEIYVNGAPHFSFIVPSYACSQQHFCPRLRTSQRVVDGRGSCRWHFCFVTVRYCYVVQSKPYAGSAPLMFWFGRLPSRSRIAFLPLLP